MSKKELLGTLDTIIEDMKKSQLFRRLVTNKQAHYIIVHVDDLEKQITAQVSSTQEDPSEPLPRGLVSLIEDESKKLLNRLAKELRPQNFGKRKISLVYRNHIPNKLFEMAVEQMEGQSSANIFDLFRKACTKSQKQSANRINKKIRDYKKRQVAELKTTTQLVEVGHVGETENLRNLIRTAQQGLLSCRTSPTSGITKFINNLNDQIEIRLQKAPLKIPRAGGIPKKNFILVTLESARLNRDTTELRELAKGVREALIGARDSLPAEQIRGSPAAVQEVQQWVDATLYNRVAETAKRVGILKDRKGPRRAGRKNISPTLAKRTRTVRGKRGIGFEFFEPITLNPGQINTPASSVSLEVLLQARLPKTVQKNMGQPALVNRTGRFASSVRALKVGENNTVTYTYQTNPYKVFETDSFRDPRQLIEKSIREIAAEIQVTNLNMIRSG